MRFGMRWYYPLRVYENDNPALMLSMTVGFFFFPINLFLIKFLLIFLDFILSFIEYMKSILEQSMIRKYDLKTPTRFLRMRVSIYVAFIREVSRFFRASNPPIFENKPCRLQLYISFDIGF